MSLTNSPVVRHRPPDRQSESIVFVVDDDVSVRESLRLLVRSVGWEVETFESAGAFLARPRHEGPGCLLLDLSLPDFHGLEVQQRMAADRRAVPIIFITGHGDVPMTVRAMKAGAAEFLTKPVDTEILLRSVASAIEQSRALLRREAELRDLRDRYATLSRREHDVMALVVSGLLNKQIGAELRISEITVKAHRGKAMRKMRAGSLADLVKMATALDTAPSHVGAR